MRYRRRWCTFALLVGTTVSLVGCDRDKQGTPEIVMPPAPTFLPPDSADRATVVRYAESLRFVTDPLLSDQQTLRAPGGARGPQARIEPAEYARKLTKAELKRGHFIARLMSTGSYEPLQLTRGVQYMWVDSIASGWRGVIVPSNPAEPARVIGLTLGEDSTHLGMSPSARFVSVGDVDITWGTCGWICCKACFPKIGPDCPDPTRFFLDPSRLPSDSVTTPPPSAARPGNPTRQPGVRP